jgi:putative ABC transport system permease protein
MRLYPRSFREESGPDLVATLGARHAAMRSRGRVRALFFVLRELAGLAVLGVALRWSRGGGKGPASERSRRPRALEVLWQDVRIAVRGLRRNAGFTAVAVIVLGLGIGASVAIFSAVSALMLRPLPFADAGRLVSLWENNAERNWVRGQVAPANWLDWRERVAELSGIAIYGDWLTGVELAGATESRRVLGSEVSGNFFDVLGVKPALGRAFTEEETWAGGETVVVLSHSLWQSAFNGDPGIVDRRIRLNRGTEARVIGVMPASLRFPREQTELWQPLGFARADVSQAWFRRAHLVRAVGRLAPGVSEARARVRLSEVARELQREHPELNRGMEADLGSLRHYLADPNSTPLLVLMGAAILLLLTACANAGNLVLVRGLSREREVAVRGALGATRRRVVAQLATESAILALGGGVAGVLAAAWATRLFALRKPIPFETLEPVTLDPRVVTFAVAVTALSAVLFGLVPALRAGRTRLTESLRDAVRTTAGSRPVRATATLVVIEMVLAMVLVSGAGLLLRNLMHLQRVATGVDVRNVLTFAISLPTGGYADREHVIAFHETVLDRIRALPGVAAAAATTRLPLTHSSWHSDFTTQGWPADRIGSEVHHREVSPGYLEALGVPLRRGRAFDARDRSDSELTVLINQALADRFFPGEDPIGKRVAFDRTPEPTSVWRTIIGIVGNERQAGVAEAVRPEFLAPLAQDWNRNVSLAVRTQRDPLELLPAVRREMRALDASLPVFDVRTMQQVHSASLARDRFVLLLFAVFAGSAFLLAIIGVYGVSAQAARARAHEIGIRFALGASPAEVQRMMAARGVKIGLSGVALGLVAALASSGLLRGFLHDVQLVQPSTFALIAAGLAGAATMASWVPAWCATRAPVWSALRPER